MINRVYIEIPLVAVKMLNHLVLMAGQGMVV